MAEQTHERVILNGYEVSADISISRLWRYQRMDYDADIVLAHIRGTWEIKDGRLFHANVNSHGQVEEGMVFADWFTGHMLIFNCNDLNYHELGYGSLGLDHVGIDIDHGLVVTPALRVNEQLHDCSTDAIAFCELYKMEPKMVLIGHCPYYLEYGFIIAQCGRLCVLYSSERDGFGFGRLETNGTVFYHDGIMWSLCHALADIMNESKREPNQPSEGTR